MSLSLAMALSGLERDHWEGFQELYDQGIIVANRLQPLTNIPINTITVRTLNCGNESLALVKSKKFNFASHIAQQDYFFLGNGSRQNYKKTKSLDNMNLFYTNNDIPMNFTPYDELTVQINRKDSKNKKKTKHEDACEKLQPCPARGSFVNWYGRNLLDLNSNVVKNKSMYCFASIPEGVDSYFENRSQISRIYDVSLPCHTIYTCYDPQCEFVEYNFT